MTSRHDTWTPPVQAATNWKTASGHSVRLRPIEPRDRDRFGAFLKGLSFGARYLRFGRGDYDLTNEELLAVCNPNLEKVRRYVVVTPDAPGEPVIAAGSFYIDPDEANCELAILVGDRWQGTRVAHRLLTELIAAAAGCGLSTMRAQVLATNTRMLRFARRHGFEDIPGGPQDAIRMLVLHLSQVDSR